MQFFRKISHFEDGSDEGSSRIDSMRQEAEYFAIEVQSGRYSRLLNIETHVLIDTDGGPVWNLVSSYWAASSGHENDADTAGFEPIDRDLFATAAQEALSDIRERTLAQIGF